MSQVLGANLLWTCRIICNGPSCFNVYKAFYLTKEPNLQLYHGRILLEGLFLV